MTEQNLIAKVEVEIAAPVEKVWDALTNPEIIQKYMFGTQVVSNWEVGSSIIWKGEWQGKPYEDKGEILRNVRNEVLEVTYWSSMGGTPDEPHNYKKVTYVLSSNGNNTHLSLTQDNCASEEERVHMEQNWKTVLDGLKKVLEE
jgi:uncharacterized protein YndB with AHSA1/START domain